MEYWPWYVLGALFLAALAALVWYLVIRRGGPPPDGSGMSEETRRE